MIWIILGCIAAGIWGLYLFMTAGKPVGSWLKHFQYAHRGLHCEEAPENSLKAFQRAVEKGYAIELDVHRSKDGKIMVFHDDNLYRMTGVSGTIEEMESDKIRELQLAGSREKIPFLSEVLSLVDGDVPLLIELKNTGAAGQLEIDTYELLKNYDGKFAIQSFSPFSVRWFRKYAPKVLRGQLSSTFAEGAEEIPAWQKWGLRHLLTNFLCRPNFINYDKEGLHQPVLQRLRRTGLPIFAWTVRTKEEGEQAFAFADALVFENFEPEKRRHD